MTSYPDDHDANVRLVRCRWSCPVCGLSKTTFISDPDEPSKPLVSLKNHIIKADGNGHGPENAYHKEFDPSTLQEHITIYENK